MFKFFRHTVPTDAAESRPVPHAAPLPAAIPPPPTPVFRPHNDIQRELVRGVFKDTLRRHGIPPELVACEVTTAANGPQDEEVHIQIVVLQWHELLLRYARALELQLQRSLDRFEPNATYAKKYTFSWRLAAECGTPFTVMPPAIVWSHNGAARPVVTESPSVLDRRQKKRPPKDGPDNYERTELSPFR